ncbi:MAG: helix-turn-helix domain-containing protein [Oscillospiraceae bacterium]|nr:helix-turn-helix domain-containing protein [Oscillospiraceae bacterium]
MTTGQRIKHRRKEIGVSAEKLAEMLGVSPATIYRYENGDIEKVPGDRLGPIAEALQTTPVYLMGWADSATDGAPNIIPIPETRKIPLLGAIACGEPILAEENIEEYIDIPKELAGDFALICRGDSMINARIFDGDIVYIRQQDSVDNGEIAAVLIDNEATLKRVRIFDDHIVLEPENPMYKPLAYWYEEMNTIRILGKAVAFTSAVR